MRQLLADAGFVDVRIDIKPQSAEIIASWMPGSGAEAYVASAYVTATKPADGRTASRDDPFRPSTARPVALLSQQQPAPEDCCAPEKPESAPTVPRPPKPAS